MTKISGTVTRSSMISGYEYDEETKEMHITFCKGGTYKYYDVPKEKFHALIADEDSMGKHFHANIKGKHNHEKV